MPAARLQPLPFPDPSRLLDLIEQEPELIEPGLRVVARRIPIPCGGEALTIEALACDAKGRCVAIRAAESISPRNIEQMLAARDWIAESLPTLRALAPHVAKSGDSVRCVILTGSIDPSTRGFLRLLAAGTAPEILEIRAFDSPSGLALSVSPVVGSTATVPHGVGAAPSLPVTQSEKEVNPLAGIPLTADELAEFRRLSNPRGHTHRPSGAADPRAPGSFETIPEHRGGFVEN